MRNSNIPLPRNYGGQQSTAGQGSGGQQRAPSPQSPSPQPITDRKWAFLCRLIKEEHKLLPTLEAWDDPRLESMLVYIDTTRTEAEQDDQRQVLDAAERIVRKVYDARGMTVRQAQRLLRDKAREGLACPCCNTLHRIYRRSFNTSLARTLIWMVRASDAAIAAGDPDGWVYPNRDAPPGVKQANEWGRLALWDCVDAGSAEVGGLYHYRATELARGMVRGERTVPRQVEVFAGDILAFSADSVSLQDAIGEKFDLSVLLSAALTDGDEWDLRALERLKAQRLQAEAAAQTD